MLPMQSGFRNNAGNLLPTRRFLDGLYNFCNYIFFDVKHDDIRRESCFTDSKMMENYQKTSS